MLCSSYFSGRRGGQGWKGKEREMGDELWEVIPPRPPSGALCMYLEPSSPSVGGKGRPVGLLACTPPLSPVLCDIPLALASSVRGGAALRARCPRPPPPPQAAAMRYVRGGCVGRHHAPLALALLFRISRRKEGEVRSDASSRAGSGRGGPGGCVETSIARRAVSSGGGKGREGKGRGWCGRGTGFEDGGSRSRVMGVVKGRW